MVEINLVNYFFLFNGNNRRGAHHWRTVSNVKTPTERTGTELDRVGAVWFAGRRRVRTELRRYHTVQP
ncbi:hypothetical protein HanRHA438_Chr10g0442391 [Helianthus annuus]|nr:hypothetical protein HanLR1_Chr10g0353171 [Helianthus annuus]KAJ0878668.1 hypothetical protein HanRHA438_Chr10g0442391 [Helianthus annuus]